MGLILAEAEDNLLAFAEKWDGEHPQISKSWQENWGRLTTFFDYPKDIRRVIYTTNTIESLNASLRKVTSTKRLSLMMMRYLRQFIWRLSIRCKNGQCPFKLSLHATIRDVIWTSGGVV
jgi:transposase-like protein